MRLEASMAIVLVGCLLLTRIDITLAAEESESSEKETAHHTQDVESKEDDAADISLDEGQEDKAAPFTDIDTPEDLEAPDVADLRNQSGVDAQGAYPPIGVDAPKDEDSEEEMKQTDDTTLSSTLSTPQ